MKNDIEKNLEALKIDKVDKNGDLKNKVDIKKEEKKVEDTTNEIIKEDKKEVDKVDKKEVDKEDKKEIIKEDKKEVDKEEADKVDKKEEQKKEGKFNFKNYAKLYRFDKEKNKFFERGEGTVKIELISDNNLYRIMLIRNKINTLACNHYLEPNSHFKQHSIANAYIWQTTTDRVEEEITLQSKYSNRSTVNEREQIYLLRFRKTDSEAAKLFEENFVDATAHNKTVLLAKK